MKHLLNIYQTHEGFIFLNLSTNNLIRPLLHDRLLWNLNCKMLVNTVTKEYCEKVVTSHMYQPFQAGALDVQDVKTDRVVFIFALGAWHC